MNLESTPTIKAFTDKYHQYLLPVGTILAALALISLVIIPQIGGFFATGEQIKTTSGKATQLEAKATELESLETSSFEKNLEVVSTLLPVDPDVPLALNYLQQLVQRSNLTTDSITYLPSEDSGSTFQLNLNVTGSLSQIRALLISLQGAPRVFQVQTITTSLSERGIQATIPISVYYGDVSPPQSSNDQPIIPLTEDETQKLTKWSSLVPNTSAVVDTSSISIKIGKNDPFE